METLYVAIAGLAVALLLWLNTLATLAVKYDHTLDKTQKIAQLFIVWLAPFIGAGFFLHLVFAHSPEAIPRNWIPWPFKKMFFGSPLPPNKNRDENEIDYASFRGSRSDSARGPNGGGEND